MMSINHIKSIIINEIEKSGYVCTSEEKLSKTTKSVYYSLCNQNGTTITFRVSNHSSKKNLITLRFDKKIDEKKVKSFVKNRIEDLQKRNLKKLLGL